jgi:hypothetical protein
MSNEDPKLVMQENYDPLVTTTVESSPTFEILIEEQGAYGRFQFFSHVITMLAINSVGYMYYGLGYLLLYPKYDCQQLINGTWVHIDSDSDNCTPDYFCHHNSTIQWSRVDNDEVSLMNWIE